MATPQIWKDGIESIAYNNGTQIISGQAVPYQAVLNYLSQWDRVSEDIEVCSDLIDVHSHGRVAYLKPIYFVWDAKTIGKHL